LVIHSTDSERGRGLLSATKCEEDFSPKHIKSQTAMVMNTSRKSLSLQHISYATENYNRGNITTTKIINFMIPHLLVSA
jgi:hypothetical protein